ncbi:MAG: FAD-dependent monooxygenase [Alphaproteobacteria bacterium]|nr:FAD-dependent monooxygenase [Alphaproteobacteria bacterium]
MGGVDVIVVGGRPAGAALAARLASGGASVLLLDRARFPSLPAVPSSPILYPSAMGELDALGVPSEAYDRPEARMRSLMFQFHPWWHTVIPVPDLRGRDYVVGVDRRELDDAIRVRASATPGCESREGWSVRDLVRDADGRVCGVVAAGEDGREERIDAGCVIGADGRFSLVARKAGAPVVDERLEHTSTVWYADWEGVGADCTGEVSGQVVTTGRGLDVLFFKMPGGRTSVNVHARSDRAASGGDAQGAYRATLDALPPVAARLAGARQVSRVVGVKRVGNGYRQAWGPGWALVGDALHYKDPVDGQGIRDALVGARLLAAALLDWREGRPWEEAMARYEAAVRDNTHAMYVATTERLKRELYDEPPVPVIRTLIRWWMTDRTYQDRFLRYLNRELPPDGWVTPRLLAGASVRGLGRDLASLFGR